MHCVDPAYGNRSVSSILVVCALYRSPLSQRVHHTSLIYDVSLSFTRDQFSMIELGSMSADDVDFVEAGIRFHSTGKRY